MNVQQTQGGLCKVLQGTPIMYGASVILTRQAQLLILAELETPQLIPKENLPATALKSWKGPEMRSRIEHWDNWIRQILLLPFLFVIYSGPAAVILIESIFDDEGYGANSLWDWALPIFVVWLFAVPFVVAYAKWDDSADISVFSLGAFTGLIALFTMVGFPVLEAATTLVLLPFNGVDNLPSDGIAFWIAKVITFLVLLGIPLMALTFQIIQLRKDTSHGL